jgi:hypothetical protein
MQLRFLLDDNAAHAGAAKALMDKFHPSLFAALDEAALLYLLTSNAFVHSQQRPVQIRMVVYLLLWRHFRWAATDVCRFRITAALGYQRQQAEAVGLFWLFDENPELGERWLAIRSDKEGREFHADTRRRVLEIMRKHELVDAYEKGSATSLHVRFAGALPALRLIPGGVPTLVDAELDPDHLSPYYASVVEFLITQQRVFRALDAANHERDFDLPRQTREAFDQHLRAVREQLGSMS